MMSKNEFHISALSKLAQAATALYALPPDLSVRMINLSENATFKIESHDGTCWAMRIHRQGYHSETAIASELAWMNSLRENKVAITPTPVSGKDGNFIQKLTHRGSSLTSFIVLSDWEHGIEPRIDGDLIVLFKSLGEATARIHNHTRCWVKPAWFERPSWNFETALGAEKPRWGRWRDGLGVDGEKERLFGRTADLIKQRLEAYGSSNERFGLVHCDLRLANVLVDDSRLKIIDFDDCGYSWYMYDAATPVSFYEHEPQVPELIEAWKDGYRRKAVLSKEDENEIQTFVMLRRLLLIAWIGSRGETSLAQSMGRQYTEQTVSLCQNFLSKYG